MITFVSLSLGIIGVGISGMPLRGHAVILTQSSLLGSRTEDSSFSFLGSTAQGSKNGVQNLHLQPTATGSLTAESTRCLVPS